MSDKDLTLLESTPSYDLCVWGSIPGFEAGQRMATALSESNIVPNAYQKNLGNCLVALDMAARMKQSPLVIMQNLNIIKGKPSFGAPYLISLINTSGLFKTRLRWEEKGTSGSDDWGSRCYAIDQFGEKVYGAWVDIAMAKADGWYLRNDKWKSMPQVMLQYRAVSFFFRQHCPELAYGIQSTEEIEDANIQVEDVPRHAVKEVYVANGPSGITAEVKATKIETPGKEIKDTPYIEF